LRQFNDIMLIKCKFLFLTIATLLIFPFVAKGQDYTYSQFYANPLYLNPALAGVEYCPRIAANYRNQWPSLPGAFVSYSLSYDQFVDVVKGGVGVILNYDKSGTAAINQFTISAMYAYRLRISERLSASFSLQGGFGQRNVKLEDLILDPSTGQGGGSPVQPVLENFDGNVNYMDFAGGFFVSWDEKFYLGGAAHHITQPNISFLDESDNQINMKITIHGGANFGFDNGYGRSSDGEFTISPNFLFQQQGNFRQMNLGTYLSYSIFVAGIWYRHAFENPDAAIILIGITRDNLRLGYSYDYSLSKLSNVSGGAHEVSVAWVFDCDKKSKRPKAIKCPRF